MADKTNNPYKIRNKYFEKSALEKVWEKEPTDTPMQVVDKKGRIFHIAGADVVDGVITIFI